MDAQKSGAPGFAYEEPLFWYSPIVTVPTVIKAYGIFRPTPLSGGRGRSRQPHFRGTSPGVPPGSPQLRALEGGRVRPASGLGRGREVAASMYEGQDGTGGDIARIKRILDQARDAAGCTSP